MSRIVTGHNGKNHYLLVVSLHQRLNLPKSKILKKKKKMKV